MFIEFLTGAGIRLASNVVSQMMANSAEKERNLHLRDKDIMDGHIQLAELHQKDNVVKLERLVVFWMLIGSFCYVSINNMSDLGQMSTVLVDKDIGFMTRFFSNSKQLPIEVSSSTFIFQLWCNIVVMLLGSYSVSPRK